MSDGNALRAAIPERPDDDALRLVYADALEETGTEHARKHAEFIRVSCHTCKRPGYKFPRPANCWLRDHWPQLLPSLLAEHIPESPAFDGPATFGRSYFMHGARACGGLLSAWFRFARPKAARGAPHPAWVRVRVRFQRGFVLEVTCKEWAGPLVRSALDRDGLLGPFVSWRLTHKER
jgi:uncharacterized protein (TIGR02996 family)